MVSLEFQLIRKNESRARLGESPVWDPETNTVWWVDVEGKKLFRVDVESGDVQAWDTPEHPGFVVLLAPGCPAIGMETGIYSFEPGELSFRLLVPLDTPGYRFNDATVDQSGQLWTSAMALDAREGAGSILQVTDELTLNRLEGNLTTPNGLAVDQERGRFFYSDSHPDIQTIWIRSVQPDTGEWGAPAVFARTDSLKGRPDGAALDDRGYYWIAGVDGSEIYVFDLEGQLDAVIPVPFPAPTKACFFGPDRSSIAVTSKGMGEDGGYLAFAGIPNEIAKGLVQPYWQQVTKKTIR